MPNKDDEDCGCTGSIDLEKIKVTSESYIDKNLKKNKNLNISKQTRNKNYGLQEKKNCKITAKTYFGEEYGCKKLESRIEKEKKLGRRIESARYTHMTKIIEGNQHGAELKLNTLGKDLFIQTYDMGENILVAEHNIWTLKINGKINKYLTIGLNMPKYKTYKEFIIDYFKNDVFKHVDYKKYNSSNLTEILDMRGSFKNAERMDFDLAANFFKERTNLRKVTIRNLKDLSETEQKKWAEYADFDFTDIIGTGYLNQDPLKQRDFISEWPGGNWMGGTRDDTNRRTESRFSPNRIAVLNYLSTYNRSCCELHKLLSQYDHQDYLYPSSEHGIKTGSSAKFWDGRPIVKTIDYLMGIHNKKLIIYVYYKFNEEYNYVVQKSEIKYFFSSTSDYKDDSSDYREIQKTFSSFTDYLIYVYNSMISEEFKVRPFEEFDDWTVEQSLVWNHHAKLIDGIYRASGEREGGNETYDGRNRNDFYKSNFDVMMQDFYNIYKTDVSQPNTITAANYRRYWSSKLNFRNEPFVLGTQPFLGCTNLQEVYLEARQINPAGKFNYFFKDLKNLHTVYLTDSITETGEGTFSGCGSLRKLQMPGVTKINKLTFQNCTNLREFTIPYGMTFIDKSAFTGCYALNKLYIRASRKTINNIFKNKKIFRKDNNIHIVQFFNDFTIDENFGNNIKHNLKRIIYPKDDKITAITNAGINGRAYVYGDKKYTYYEDLSKLPNDLIKDLRTEKLDGVKTFNLKVNPSNLPLGYNSIKTNRITNNVYIIFGPGVNLEGADFNGVNLNSVDLTGINLSNTNLIGVKTYNVKFEDSNPPTLPNGYEIIKINDKKNIVGKGVHLSTVDLSNYDLNNLPTLEDVNLSMAKFNNTISLIRNKENFKFSPILQDELGISNQKSLRLKNKYTYYPDGIKKEIKQYLIIGNGTNILDADLTDKVIDDVLNINNCNLSLANLKAQTKTEKGTEKGTLTNFYYNNNTKVPFDMKIIKNKDNSQGNLIINSDWRFNKYNANPLYQYLSKDSDVQDKISKKVYMGLINNKNQVIDNLEFSIKDKKFIPITENKQNIKKNIIINKLNILLNQPFFGLNLTYTDLNNINSGSLKMQTVIYQFMYNFQQFDPFKKHIWFVENYNTITIKGEKYFDLSQITDKNKNIEKKGDLTDVELKNKDLNGIKTYYTKGTPKNLPKNYKLLQNKWKEQMIVGPGVYLQYANFDKVDFTGCDLSNVNMNNAIIENTNFSNIKYNTIPKIRTSYKFVKDDNGKNFIFGPNVVVKNMKYKNKNVNDITKKLSLCIFEECEFNSSKFIGGEFTSWDLKYSGKKDGKTWYQKRDEVIEKNTRKMCDLTKSEFKNCDLTNADFTRCNFDGLKTSNLTITDNKITLPFYYDLILGPHWTPELIKNFARLPVAYQIKGENKGKFIVGPNINLSNMNLSNIDLSGVYLLNNTGINVTSNKNTKLPKNYIIRNKILLGPNLNLQNQNLSVKYKDLSNLNLYNTSFRNSNLSNVNFTGSTLSGADIRYTILEGTIFTNVTVDKDFKYDEFFTDKYKIVRDKIVSKILH